MKLLLLSALLACSALAADADDSRPAASNVMGSPYPRIHSDLRASFRLLAPDAQEPTLAARSVLARVCECGDWEDLLASLSAAREAIAGTWQQTFGETLDLTAESA